LSERVIRNDFNVNRAKNNPRKKIFAIFIFCDISISFTKILFLLNDFFYKESIPMAEIDENGKIETLDGFIKNDQDLIKWSAISSIGLFVIGISASGLIYLITQSSADLVKLISAIPGLAGTLVSGILAKEYFDKRKRIISCQLFRKAYSTPPAPEQIDQRFWKLVDDSLTK